MAVVIRREGGEKEENHQQKRIKVFVEEETGFWRAGE